MIIICKFVMLVSYVQYKERNKCIPPPPPSLFPQGKITSMKRKTCFSPNLSEWWQIWRGGGGIYGLQSNIHPSSREKGSHRSYFVPGSHVSFLYQVPGFLQLKRAFVVHCQRFWMLSMNFKMYSLLYIFNGTWLVGVQVLMYCTSLTYKKKTDKERSYFLH